MPFLILVLFVLFTGCKEKELTPVGQEYQLIDSETPMSITLGFNPDGRFYGKAINSYWGQYHIRDNIISFSGITSTMKSGTKPQMQAERKFFDSLTNGHSFKITEDNLKIFFDESGVLNFKVKLDNTNISHYNGRNN